MNNPAHTHREPRRQILGVFHPLGSPRLGIAFIIAFAIYAALASLPLFPATWLDAAAAAEAPRVTLRHLPFIDRTEGEYFAWWPGVSLLIAIVINMTISMLTRVAWSWRTSPVLLTHAGVLLLALGSAIYAAQKQEGEVLLTAPPPGSDIGPAATEMLDKARAELRIVWDSPAEGDHHASKTETRVILDRIPRFHPWQGDPGSLRDLPIALSEQGGRWYLAVNEFHPAASTSTTPSEDRAGSRVTITEFTDSQAPAGRFEVPFSRHAPHLVRLTPQRAESGDARFGPLRVPMPGVSLGLQDIALDLVPGTDTPRRVSATVRTHTGDSRTISLNEPLTLDGLAPPTCDCFIRGTVERLWYQHINPQKWKFSIAGWDHQGWLMSREATIAGLTDRPRAGFIVLGVGTTPGIRIIAAGGILTALGMGVALLLRTFGRTPLSSHAESAGTPAPPPAPRTIPPHSSSTAASLIAAAVLLFGACTGSARAAADSSAADPAAPLRTVPVQWNGRIAPLDTVARDIIRAISGRPRVPTLSDANQVEDPLLTLLDLSLDPEQSATRALLRAAGVAIPPQFITPSGLISQAAAESILASHTTAAQQGTLDARAARSSAALAERLALSRLTIDRLPVLVAAPNTRGPASTDWLTLSDSDSPPPIRAAFEQLQSVWRTGDTQSVLLAAHQLSESLRAHNQRDYSTNLVWFEALTNTIDPARSAAWLYAIAAILALVSFASRTTASAGNWCFLVALALHAVGFACRWIIAARIPIQNQYESMLGLSLAACFSAGIWSLFLTNRARAGTLIAAASIIGFGVLGIAHAAPIPGYSIEPEAAILGTASLLQYHVGAVLAAYAFILLGGVLSATWLVAGISPARFAAPRDAIARSLAPLMRLAFWTLGIGILLGALWADRSWGRWWAFDPKETWALITWLVYLIAIHVHAGRGTPPPRTLAWLHVIGTLIMIWTWFGVNLLLPGLHAYAG